MKGSHNVRITNSRMLYEFTIRRNITVIQGDSATGKTELCTLIQAYRSGSGEDSGVSVSCDVPCRILTNDDWENSIKNIENSIVFIDEGNGFVQSVDFARAARRSSNYYVIITRERLANLPYSVDEVYGIRTSQKYAGSKKTYNELFHLYGSDIGREVFPKNILVEDSNAGFEFFSALSDGKNYVVTSAAGKANIFDSVQRMGDVPILVIADGAAFGSEMSRMMSLASENKNIVMYLPESFEWILLKSGIIDETNLTGILQEPEKYIESSEFFCWEQYFTRLLIDVTSDTYLRYSKSKLNEVYLHPDNTKKIKEVIRNVHL